MSECCPHKAGELAYVDSFDGLIPCKVVTVELVAAGGRMVARPTVRFTSDRHVWARGEVRPVESFHVVPRSHVLRKRARFGPVLVEGWRWEVGA